MYATKSPWLVAESVPAYEAAPEPTDPGQLEDLRMEAGLGPAGVRRRLHQRLRLHEVGQRPLAFYLVEFANRRLHKDSGHESTAHFAEQELGLDRRRTSELIAVGRALLELTAVDRAFCAGEISWSKVLLIARVAIPPHEAAWLERAKARTYRELQLEVQRAKPGAAPRADRDRMGHSEVRFPIRVSLSPVQHQKFELVRAKLEAERGVPQSDADVLEALAAFAETASPERIAEQMERLRSRRRG